MNSEFASIRDIIRPVFELFRPPPNLTVSEWAEAHRFLSSESSASPGRFRNERTPYLKEPMDMIGEPGVRRIVLMTSAQVGKSTLLENALGYFIDYDPCPILHVSPTINSQKMFSKERLAPMLRDCPSLAGKVKEAKSRDSGNTLDSKIFAGGHLAMVGANAPSGLASRPVRVVLFDEIDRYELSAGSEGDPISLAIKRTTTYWNRVILEVSTPGDKTTSRIEPEFLRGDQRYYWAKCPHCEETQRLRWAQVKFEVDNPDGVRYICEHHGCVWDDEDRNVAVRNGEWRAEKPFNGVVSYHLSQLYSPFAPLADGVRDFLAAKDNPNELKTWVNTFLGESWEERGQRLDWSDLMDQREEYDVPEEITLITCAVDIQDDRAEIEWVGWGDDYQSWSLDYVKVYGDPSTPQFWENLRSSLQRDFEHPLFERVAVRNIVIDSGGHFTTGVYKFAATMPRAIPIKGVGGPGKPMIGKPSRNTIGRVTVVPLGVDTIKEWVVAALKVRDSTKAGYCHFPMEYESEYFRGITAEELRTKFIKGFKIDEWHKVYKRNEPFDLRVYNRAALEMLQVDLNALRRHMLQELGSRAKRTETTKKTETNGSSFATSWKNG